MVESGAKSLIVRFAGPHRRWARNGAENLSPIRTAVLSRCFDHVWAPAENLRAS